MKYGVMVGTIGCLPNHYDGPYDSLADATDAAIDYLEATDEYDMNEAAALIEVAQAQGKNTLGAYYFGILDVLKIVELTDEEAQDWESQD